MKKVKQETIDSFGEYADKVAKLVKELGHEIEEKREPKRGEIWIDRGGEPFLILPCYVSEKENVSLGKNAGWYAATDLTKYCKYAASSPEEYFKKKFAGEL